MTPTPGPDSLLIIIPAFNEEGAIAGVVEEVRQFMPGTPILVIDDCSVDSTAARARQAGAELLALPHHLGLGGCVQAGYKLAFELGYQYVIRVDGDGQHDGGDIPRIFEVLRTSGCQMVIGSRFVPGSQGKTTVPRSLAIRFFRLVLRPILGKPVRDPTSGFVGVNREALSVFRTSFPLDYPEIEALVVLQRKAFRFEEVPTSMRPRKAGRSTITALKSVNYMLHVLLGVFVNILKYEGKRRRRRS
ncbi:MAG TPA: glycosyl transferase family 2 [Solibacterales bacterium]|nr:glycosyl transferase family 2 [Bryobacterales bacterium]